MSVTPHAWVINKSQTRGNDFVVLLMIADEANDEGMNAFPSIERIARKARVERKTVLRAIEHLREMGELLVRRPDSPGRGRFNRYVVVMDRDPIALLDTIGWPAEAGPTKERSQSGTISDQDKREPREKTENQRKVPSEPVLGPIARPFESHQMGLNPVLRTDPLLDPGSNENLCGQNPPENTTPPPVERKPPKTSSAEIVPIGASILGVSPEDEYRRTGLGSARARCVQAIVTQAHESRRDAEGTGLTARERRGISAAVGDYLDAGFSAAQIVEALAHTSVVTANGLGFQLRSGRNTGPPQAKRSVGDDNLAVMNQMLAKFGGHP